VNKDIVNAINKTIETLKLFKYEKIEKEKKYF
jgi:hypothetical protein